MPKNTKSKQKKHLCTDCPLKLLHENGQRLARGENVYEELPKLPPSEHFYVEDWGKRREW